MFTVLLRDKNDAYFSLLSKVVWIAYALQV